MTQVGQYFAQPRPAGRSARSRRSPSSYPIRSTAHLSAMSAFGANLAGVLMEEVNRRTEVLEQNEISLGSAEWDQGFINAQEDFRGDTDYKTYVERYTESNKQLQKTILDGAMLPASKQYLQQMMRAKTPGQIAAVSDLAWDGQLRQNTAKRDLNTEMYKDFWINAPGPESEEFWRAKMEANILEDPLLTDEEKEVDVTIHAQDAIKRRELIVKQRHLDALSNEAMSIFEREGETEANEWLRKQEGLSRAERGEVEHRLNGQIADRKRQIEEDEKKFELDIIDLPTTTPIEDVMSSIRNGPLDRSEQDALLRSVLFRREALAKGDPDPHIYRHNNSLYWELLQKSIDRTITEKELRKSVGWDPENRERTGITVNDYLQMVNILGEKDGLSGSKAQTKTTVMKNMDGFFDDLVADTFDAAGKQAVRTAQIKARNILEGRMLAAEDAGQPLTGVKLTEEMLRVQREVQDELLDDMGFIEATSEQLLPAIKKDPIASAKQVATYQKQLARKVTKKEFDALPSGAIFIDPNGKYRRKP